MIVSNPEKSILHYWTEGVLAVQWCTTTPFFRRPVLHPRTKKTYFMSINFANWTQNCFCFFFLYKASLTDPPTLYLKYLQREMLKEDCFQFPLTFIFDSPPRAIYCFIREFPRFQKENLEFNDFLDFLWFHGSEF